MSSLSAPMKLLPLSEYIDQTSPYLAISCLSAKINESVSKENVTSIWTALLVMQVNIAPYLLISLLLCFAIGGSNGHHTMGKWCNLSQPTSRDVPSFVLQISLSVYDNQHIWIWGSSLPNLHQLSNILNSLLGLMLYHGHHAAMMVLNDESCNFSILW